jgi:outer membrane lipoprotein-sorting protein
MEQIGSSSMLVHNHQPIQERKHHVCLFFSGAKKKKKTINSQELHRCSVVCQNQFSFFLHMLRKPTKKKGNIVFTEKKNCPLRLSLLSHQNKHPPIVLDYFDFKKNIRVPDHRIKFH